MKKMFISVFALVTICCSACDAGVVTKDKLTNSEMALIDCVFDNMSMWDNRISRDDVTYSVNKISFFKFSSEMGMSFYVSWPIPSYSNDFGYAHSAGFYVSENEMIPIGDFSIYEADAQRSHDSFIMRVSYDGSSWNGNADDEEKYNMIVDAYLQYRNR